MYSALVIKKITENDVNLIQRLAHVIWHQYFPQNEVITEAQVNYMLHKYYSTVALKSAMEQGELFFCITSRLAKRLQPALGFFSYKIDSLEKVMQIKKVFLIKEWQRKGVFSNKIVKYMENVARVSDLDAMELFVNRNNYGAIAAYEACDFQRRGDITIPIGNGFEMNDQIMKKNLNEPARKDNNSYFSKSDHIFPGK